MMVDKLKQFKKEENHKLRILRQRLGRQNLEPEFRVVDLSEIDGPEQNTDEDMRAELALLKGQIEVENARFRRLIYGAGKGIVRACKGSAKHATGNNHPTHAENDQVVDMQGALNDVSDSEEEKELYLSNGLTNPDGTPVVEKKGRDKHARVTSQHDEDGDSLT